MIKTRAEIPLNPLAERKPEAVKPVAEKPKPVIKPKPILPKPQAAQPVATVTEPGKRGRKPSDDPREKLSLRLPASLIADLDAQKPNWKAEIENLLRDYLVKSP
jgi:uncharacterized protein (DUF4415 family)